MKDTAIKLQDSNPLDRRRFLAATAVATLAATAKARDYGPHAQPVRYPDPDVIVLDKRFAKYKLPNAPIQRLHTGTLWAGTRRGKIFISRNADGPAAAVTWTRLDTLSPAAPNRFPSAIYVDPSNGSRAWISYSGYSANTPTRPGHVFEVTWDPIAGTATWTPLDGSAGGALGDLPITAVARDDATGDLYAGTDFGVMRCNDCRSATAHWHVAATGMPASEIPHHAIDVRARVLYAGTHGRGAWRLWLPGASGDRDD